MLNNQELPCGQKKTVGLCRRFAEAGKGDVAIRHDAGIGPDQQPGRADAAAGGDLAEKEFWEATAWVVAVYADDAERDPDAALRGVNVLDYLLRSRGAHRKGLPPRHYSKVRLFHSAVMVGVSNEELSRRSSNYEKLPERLHIIWLILGFFWSIHRGLYVVKSGDGGASKMPMVREEALGSLDGNSRLLWNCC